ncbi:MULTISPECIES: hypothetical protein [Bacillus cereus group]|jgi:uncharacterized protein YuzE|uniref:hypothetical protein n=1 Tax=Bacillus cereus group TaxID=86661 RepID=UPI0011A039D4|nr:hypothetical protein [Bacillus thuringiensis]MEB8860887.1 hypothetical protein [Bacillus cereus]MDR5047134.1 hypothetical protein [Bacillus thuringiensis]MEB9417412.1 hypothetical protein [Bacillus cereus]MRC87398.1 hypothetical protein [Bacillus thuringiensis]HDR7762426.1 hypothetical protein [Bacillus cereus]
MITTAKLVNWREHGDMINLECELNGKPFEISTYKERLYNVHLLKVEIYVRLDVHGKLIGINI